MQLITHDSGYNKSASVFCILHHWLVKTISEYYLCVCVCVCARVCCRDLELVTSSLCFRPLKLIKMQEETCNKQTGRNCLYHIVN